MNYIADSEKDEVHSVFTERTVSPYSFGIMPEEIKFRSTIDQGGSSKPEGEFRRTLDVSCVLDLKNLPQEMLRPLSLVLKAEILRYLVPEK